MAIIQPLLSAIRSLSPVQITFVGDGSNNSGSSSSYTFSSQSIGVASSDRVVIVSIYAKGSGTNISTVTIGGTSMTKIVQSQFGEGDASIFAVAKPTGTSGDLVISVGGTTDRIFYGIHTMTGTGASSAATSTDTASASNSMSITLNVLQDGGALVVGGGNNSGGVSVSGLSKDWEEIAVGSGGGGSGSNLTANASLSVSMTVPTSHQNMVGAAWPPA